MSKFYCIASIDVGQTYFATCVLSRNCAKEKFELAHLAIDEFVPGLAPHQPVYPGLQTERQNPTDKIKRKVASPYKRNAKHTGSEGSGARVTLNEMDAVRKAAELVRRIVYEFGVQFMLVEDQMPNVRRNRLIQATIVSTCVALDVEVLSLAPPTKFNFSTISLQKLVSRSNESRKAGPKSLKSLSKDIYINLVEELQINNQLHSYEDDLKLLDIKSIFGQEGFVKKYQTVADWYKKDLTDALWQAVCGLRMCYSSGPMHSGPDTKIESVQTTVENQSHDPNKSENGIQDCVCDDDDSSYEEIGIESGNDCDNDLRDNTDNQVNNVM